MLKGGEAVLEIVKLDPRGRLGAAGASVTALGFFDGVHLGHRQLFLAAVAEAARRGEGTVPAVFTFSDDVRRVKVGAARLTDFETKLSLIEAAGIRRVYVADFPSVAGLSPEEFVSEILVRRCGTVFAVCGFNFRFGHRAAGDAALLSELMRASGGDAAVIPPLYLGDMVISSSAIRAAIEAGDMPRAAAMLGRPFSLTAPVLHGRGFGHTAGVPTVNQVFAESGILPKSGVYACRVRFADGASALAVANVGVCPTFGGDGDVHCETHLIDYAGDLYGERVTVEFLRYLRPERRFESPEALYAQVRNDIEDARKAVSDSSLRSE